MEIVINKIEDDEEEDHLETAKQEIDNVMGNTRKRIHKKFPNISVAASKKSCIEMSRAKETILKQIE